jgi:plastocyanin
MPCTRRHLFGVVASGVAVAAAGCVGLGGTAGGESTPTETPTPAGTATSSPTSSSSPSAVVEMVDSAYDPIRAGASSGATVRWENRDSYEHTVTATRFHDAAASWSFDESVAGGESVDFTFDEPGVYEYYCTVHGESMCGAVLVGDAALDASLPCEGDGAGDDGGRGDGNGSDDGDGGGGGNDGGYY